MSKMFKALKKIRHGSRPSSLALSDEFHINKSQSDEAVHMKKNHSSKKALKLLHSPQNGKTNILKPEPRIRRDSAPATLANRKRSSASSLNSTGSAGSAEDLHGQRLSQIAQLNRYIESLKTSVNDDNIACVPSRMCCVELLRRVYCQREREYLFKARTHSTSSNDKESKLTMTRSKTFHHPERSAEEGIERTPSSDRFVVYPKGYVRNCHSMHNMTKQNHSCAGSINTSAASSLNNSIEESDEEPDKGRTGFYISSESLAEDGDQSPGKPIPHCKPRHYSMSMAQQGEIEIF